MLEAMPPALIVVDDPDAEVEEVTPEFGGFSPSPAVDFSGGGVATEASPGVGASTSTKPTPAKRTVRTSPRRQKKQKNPMFEVAKIVIGGVVGIAMAMLILWWGFGRDPLRIAPKVAQYSFARWIVPSSLQGNAAPADPEETPGTGLENQPSGIIINNPHLDGLGPVEPSDGASNRPRANPDPFGVAAGNNPKPANPPTDPLAGAPGADPFSADPFGADPFAVDPPGTPDLPDPELPGLPEPGLPEPELPGPADPVPSFPDTGLTLDPADAPKPEPNPSLLVNAQAPAPEVMGATIRDAVVLQQAYSEAGKEDQQLFLNFGQQFFEAASKAGEAVSHSDTQHEEVRDHVINLQSAVSDMVQLDFHTKVLGALGEKWLADGEWNGEAQRPNGGAIAAGSIAAVKTIGPFVEAKVLLRARGDQSTYVTVLTDKQHDPPLQSGDTLLAVGKIVSEPKKDLQGYVGDESRVIYSRVYSIKQPVEESTEPKEPAPIEPKDEPADTPAEPKDEPAKPEDEPNVDEPAEPTKPAEEPTEPAVDDPAEPTSDEPTTDEPTDDAEESPKDE